MQTYHPDRVVRLLTALTTVAFYGVLILSAVLLIAAPAAKLFAGEQASFVWGVEVPADVQAEVAVSSPWGAGNLDIHEARGSVKFPIAILPWGVLALLMAFAAVEWGLLLLFLNHLRRMFQRVRDGTPFDASNAVRLRAMGMLLLALALFNGLADLVVAVAVRGHLADGPISVPGGLSVDMSLMFFSLVLIALAEIFRRGTELEVDQSLVV